ncbi:aminotransferase class V-fold PLP-dependent enzyme [Hoyosella subflava]|uniref:Aminotransferase, class V n=1 Tax=Hoyosella subflava (strain DSM 45089 / JCM 17490 / NBRC 109087 / DQS3-9A1) TaxID=443218 RepID=F6EEV0_HOYSD|nr:aminotransferase class V-fold PLP-dependent enzyme [Hoyosella subflava]AEF40900.1 Aminotransferase, class V [Hoyosella subflava DQS3-9A1]
MTPDPLPVQRDRFDLPEDVAYLNCAYMSPQLRTVSEAGIEAVKRKAQPWRLAPSDFFTSLEKLRHQFGALTGLDSEGVALGPSVSYGMATAASNITLREGDQVLMLAEEFPSPFYAFSAAAARSGAEVLTIPRPSSAEWTRQILAAIDERTAVVAIPPCHWTDGATVDLVAIGAAAREAGAVLVVDASQWLGAETMDVTAIQPDVVCAVGYKWLFGPFNLSYAWFAPHLRTGVPLEGNWLSRAGSDDFNRLVAYTENFQAGARRYDMGEASSFIHVPMAIAALTQVEAWGIDRIAAATQQHIKQIVSDAEDLGLSAVPEAHRSAHLVGLTLPADAPSDMPRRFTEAGVYVSFRGGVLRVAPSVYNTKEDLTRFRDVLAGCL